MNYKTQQQFAVYSLNASTQQEQAHQQTLDYFQKEIKEVSQANLPHSDKFSLVPRQLRTPLAFKVSLGTHGFLVSFKSNELFSSLIKILVLLAICALLTFPLFSYKQINANVRITILALMYSIPLLYGLLYFLDPGTVFEDEQQSFSEERIYCISCQIYRNLSTKHCSFCNKCCKKYDHHCSVFGKCIGKRNLIFFYLFIVNTASTFFLYFFVSIAQLYGQFNQKVSQA